MSALAASGASGRRAAVAVVGALAVVTVLVALAAPAGLSVARHAYLVPVVAAALRWGFAAGVVAGGGAGLLYAPFVLPGIERDGLSEAATEGLATLCMLLIAGGLTGALAGAVRRERQRHRLLVALQQVVSIDGDLPTVLERVRAELARRLGGDIALVVRGPDGAGAAGPPELLASGAVAATLATGATSVVPDLGGSARVRRLVVAPITARDGTIGVVAVARFGEIGLAERASLVALGAAVGLALENARLVARQRRFASELEEQVASARRELEAIVRTKSMLVTTASHELRTPLTALRGFSELLARRRLGPEQVRRYAVIMERETERLSRLVEDLLDLSRLEQGLPPPLRRAAVNVRSALEAAAGLFARDGVVHQFVVDCAEGLPPVDADPDALDRIVKNLLTNAVKYSPPGPVRVSARPRGDHVEIAVEDRGRGIPPDALPRLFEPYFRVPDSAGLAPGTGIGLAVVKALVEAHGGAISVDSAVGRGTRVGFLLPVATTAHVPPGTIDSITSGIEAIETSVS